MKSKNNTPKPANKSSRSILSIAVSTLILLLIFALGIILGDRGVLNGAIFNPRGNLDLQTSNEIYGILSKSFDGELNSNNLQHGSASGIANATGDRYTRYLNPEQANTTRQRSQGVSIGIGIEVGVKNGQLVVIAPISGSPAKEAGIQPGDIITKIDNVAVRDMTEQQASAAIRGSAGSNVDLKIMRGQEEKNFSITRRPFVIPSVEAKIDSNNIGILKINTFDDNTGRLSRAEVEKFINSRVKGIVLDMQDNPGGSVIAARDVLSLWVPENTIIMTEKRNSKVIRTYSTQGKPIAKDIPTVVTLDSGSASASELVAGALRDLKDIQIVGEQSFGKGSVQELRTLSNGGMLIFTVSRWFTPDGHSIDGTGITPDQKVNDQNQSSSATLDLAVNLLIKYTR
ncbi:MAG: carboxyl-terminal processing protease [Patescibacteria group bacterium]|nr:carboxyl-terminal processing protease [Patescibacteria group bacterium]